MIEIFKTFTFDAAHHLAPNVDEKHPFSRVHGHSFKVKVFLRGEPDAKTGWLMSFEDIEKILASVRNELDHHYLNEIPGLELPTLENISQWLWKKLKPQIPLLCRVTIKRGSLGEGCTFDG
jgi:6-pyruvoyltetrahydropterin/6-carboxytetrahydropterin synthase